MSLNCLRIFFRQSGKARWWRVSYQRGLPRLINTLSLVSMDFFFKVVFVLLKNTKVKRNRKYTYLKKKMAQRANEGVVNGGFVDITFNKLSHRLLL